MRDPNRPKRLAEATTSTAWTIEQANETDHYYLVNDGTPLQAAQKLYEIVQNRIAVSPKGAMVAAEFQARLQGEENI